MLSKPEIKYLMCYRISCIKCNILVLHVIIKIKVTNNFQVCTHGWKVFGKHKNEKMGGKKHDKFLRNL